MGFNSTGRGLILFLIFASNLFGSVPKDLSFFDDKPRSLTKDFYIYRYLKEPTTTSKEAEKLLGMTSRMSMSLFHAFAKKIDDEGFKKVSKCLKMKLKPLLNSDNECLAIGFNLYNATKLDKNELKKVEKKLADYGISKALHVLYADDPFVALSDTNTTQFFTIFNGVGSKYREEFFDHEVSEKKIKELEKDWNINSTIKYIVTDRKLKNINKSLIKIDRSSPKLTHESLFFLGLNALELRYKKLAMAFFDESYKKAYYRMDKDKVLFWQFLVSKDKKYKDEIAKSFDINIYTLLCGIENKNIVVPIANGKHPTYDETDPFGWTNLLRQVKNKSPEELKKIADTYKYANTLPIYSFLMERSSGYKKHYFPIPYKEYLKTKDNRKIALTMAIARQESRLIPSALSHSYALGMMQFMPFLARAIAKQEKIKNFDLDDMFNPKTALNFANIHIGWLEKSLYTPIFIAYAYNGGIGFTKKLLLSGSFRKGKYEPFLSMELVNYDESRKYGKKVLANYVTYMQILDEKVSVYKLFEDLTDPSKTDRFR